MWSVAFYVIETWTLRKEIRNTYKIFKCGTGEGWRSSVGLIM